MENGKTGCYHIIRWRTCRFQVKSESESESGPDLFNDFTKYIRRSVVFILLSVSVFVKYTVKPKQKTSLETETWRLND